MDQPLLDLTKPAHTHADERLRNDPMIWLSTVRPDGHPHLVAVWFLWDGSSILIFSKPDQKIRHLRQNPAVALALDDTPGGGDVQVIEGTAALVSRTDVAAALPAYTAKYGSRMAQMGLTVESMGAEYSETIRITPTKIRTNG